MTVTVEDIARLSRLARLALSPEEARALATDVDAIMGRFTEIEAVAVGAPPAEAAPPLGVRADEAVPAPIEEREGIVAAFPRIREGLVDVPRGLP